MKAEKVLERGYHWRFYPSEQSKRCILLAGLDRNVIISAVAKYFVRKGVSVLVLPTDPMGNAAPGLHGFPLECVKTAIAWLRARGIQKIGIMGSSTTAMLALTIASRTPEITLTLACTPSNFVMQGFFNGKLDGRIPEWPAPGESVLNDGGKPAPYAPFNLTPEEYYALSYGAATKEAGELNARKVFAKMEKEGIPAESLIPVENIRGKICLFGAEDDTLWPTADYIRRMEARLRANGNTNFEAHIFEYGTHLMFPQGVVKNILPFGINFVLGRVFKSAKAHPKECEQARREVDQTIVRALEEWSK